MADASINAAPPPTPANPYTWESTDFAGFRIGIVINFDNGTLSITNGTAYRDAECQYKKIYIGTGSDGTPDTTGHVFNVASGSQNLAKGQFTAAGLDTIMDVLNEQITAGP